MLIGMTHSKLLLNEREAAARLGVPVEWLRKEAKAGRVPFIPVGRCRRYLPGALVAALAHRANQEGVKRG